MQIVTTPMCEPVLKWAEIGNYIVNKNPDQEEADLAIVLSETETEMASIKIKLNTFSQIQNSVEKLQGLIETYFQNQNPEKIGLKKDKTIENTIKRPHDFPINSKWLDEGYKNMARKSNGKIKVQVYSNFISDIVEDMGFQIVQEEPDFIIYPDYLESKLQEKLKGKKSIKIPSHGNASLNPVERAQFRYDLLERKICTKL